MDEVAVTNPPATKPDDMRKARAERYEAIKVKIEDLDKALCRDAQDHLRPAQVVEAVGRLLRRLSSPLLQPQRHRSVLSPVGREALVLGGARASLFVMLTGGP